MPLGKILTPAEAEALGIPTEEYVISKPTTADYRSAARRAEMELDFAKAAALWEAAIFHYPPAVARGALGQRDLELMREKLRVARSMAAAPISEAD